MTDNNIQVQRGPSIKSIKISCPSDGVKSGDLILCVSSNGDFFNGAYYFNGSWNNIISASETFNVQQMKSGGQVVVSIDNDNIKRYISYITGPNH